MNGNLLYANQKGRFSVTHILEGERYDIQVDLLRFKENEEDSDSRPSIESTTPKSSNFTHAFPPVFEKEPSIESYQEKHARKYDPENSEASLVNNNCLKVFHNLMNTKYIEMINFHKEEMLDYMKRDTERQQKMMKMLEDIAYFTKANIFLEQENVKLRKLIIDKGRL